MRITITAAILAIAGVAATPAWAQDHAGHHGQHDVRQHQAAPQPAATGRHATDEPLRQGMQNIRAAVDELGHYEAGHGGTADAVRLAGEVEVNVRFIISNCSLPDAADAALHAIIMPLTRNAAALREDPANREAIPAMREALKEYARQFDDPGFPGD